MALGTSFVRNGSNCIADVRPERRLGQVVFNQDYGTAGVQMTVSYEAPPVTETNLVITAFHGDGKLTWINNDTNLFYRVCGSSNRLVYAAPVPKTGQTNSTQSGDNGYYTNDVTWPNPRFTVLADTNCVLDNLTGLIWTRNARLGGERTWSDAIATGRVRRSRTTRIMRGM